MDMINKFGMLGGFQILQSRFLRNLSVSLIAALIRLAYVQMVSLIAALIRLAYVQMQCGRQLFTVLAICYLYLGVASVCFKSFYYCSSFA